MYYVYVLKLDEKGGKRFYIGYTKDLKSRMLQHENGYTRSTKGRNPKLIYYEAYMDKYLAINREKGLKSSGSVYVSLLKRIGEK